VTEHDGIGLGRDVRFAAAGAADVADVAAVSGVGLVAGDELVQLTAFASDAPGGGEPRPRRARIRRPSQRR
jgi:hypothetical protein